MSDAIFFVWRETQKGTARPELWFGDKQPNFKPVPTLARHELDRDQAWNVLHGLTSLAELALSFPPPEIP